MKLIYATYNQYCNSIDITTFNNMILRIDCNKAEALCVRIVVSEAK